MDEPKLPDDLVMAIGRVAVNGAMLEQDIVLYMWMNLGHALPTGVRGGKHVEVPSDQFSRALKDLRKVARMRLAGSLRADFTRYLDAAQRAYEQRNRVVHGTWRAVPDQFGRHRCQGLKVLPTTDKPVVDMWSPADVGEIADQVLAARELFSQIQFRLIDAIPELNHFLHPGAVPAELLDGRPGIA